MWRVGTVRGFQQVYSGRVCVVATLYDYHMEPELQYMEFILTEKKRKSLMICDHKN